ncbi:MAG: transposase, family [Nocardioides sp.]|nr:transposase, family [Nocardioides sp.]
MLQLRRLERRGQDWLGPELGIPARTVGAILHRHRVPLLYVHAAVDDHTRLAYAEILINETGATCAAFLTRAAAFFAGHVVTIRQVISDNALNYIRSGDFADAVASIGAEHITIKPHCPWQNKVERFNRTVQAEWAYRQVFATNNQRAARPWPVARVLQESTPPLSHRRTPADQSTVMNLPAEYI